MAARRRWNSRECIVAFACVFVVSSSRSSSGSGGGALELQTVQLIVCAVRIVLCPELSR